MTRDIWARAKRRNPDSWIGYLFIAPSIVGFSVFVLYPLVTSVYYSLTAWNGVTPPQYIGLRNFIYLFTSDVAFWPSLKATGLFVLMSVPSSIALGLGLAVLLNRKIRGIRFFRTIFYLPVVLPSVATLTLWKFIFDPKFGFANELLQALHLPTSLWLGSYSMALPSIVIIGLWGVGGTMIIFLAGLQSVPEELYEAARIEGGGDFTVFRAITLPLMSPIIFLELVMGIIGATQAFNQPAVLTGGGPGFSTDLFMYNIWQNAFQNQQFGLAEAQVWILFVAIIIVSLFTFRLSTMWVYTDENGEP
ncbi:MAG: sugar ABC transporter permease [Firmicutes bacterium]|nr:sugar ABC transporter permease [Bacillota bacterium]